MPAAPTGNIGEWSELYVTYKLLGDARLYAADEDLERLEDEEFLPVLKVYRRRSHDTTLHYITGDFVDVFDGERTLATIPKGRFEDAAHDIFKGIENAKTLKKEQRASGAFAIPGTSGFMEEACITTLKAASDKKADIELKTHDGRTGVDARTGWSIKSQAGQASTLLNAGRTTNFIYEIAGANVEDALHVNSIKSQADRMKALGALGTELKFERMENSVFAGNLMFIDCLFPNVMAEALKVYYTTSARTCLEVVEALHSENPLGFPSAVRGAENLYAYNFKKFLSTIALGDMRPATPWNGKEDANGGYIVVRGDGEIVAFHVYNRDFFEQYLLDHTRFERASRKRHGYGEVYVEDGRAFIELNLQIRFM